ncbi:MAG: DUF1254 domain-containing protein [Proteobacteria bacterium]|nr:DUF1254 domain-containing protein [Pseudomonadota bacterium]
MKNKIIILAVAFLAAVSVVAVVFSNWIYEPRNVSTSDITGQQTIERRAVDAAIWGMPIVSMDAMRQAFFRDADAKYNDIVYWSEPSDWKTQLTTPNTTTYYVYFNFNTREGPIVVEIPPAAEAGLFGSFIDAWQVPLIDVGPAGEDQGKGGKYLFLPPDFDGDVPPGYIVVRSQTYNGYALFRAIPKSSSQADVDNAIALVRAMRLYPMAQAGNPPEQRFVDMAGKLFDGIVRFDEGFYASLARMVNEEPVLAQDMAMMGLVRSLGIEKGKEFKPDTATKRILAQSARNAHVWLMSELPNFITPFWPDSNWVVPITPVGPETIFSFKHPNYLDIDARGVAYFFAFAPPKKFGTATFYLNAYKDANGNAFRGEKSYRLHVPAGVPVRQFWALTLYDFETAGFIRNMPRAGVDSLDQGMKRNADGSVDIYVGPKPPRGWEANWIQTAYGHGWFPMFRFYGPEPSFFEKTWRLEEFKEINLKKDK